MILSLPFMPITLSILQLLTGTYSSISAFIASYGDLAIVILMTLESASLPIPSEVLLPLAGAFAAQGYLGGPYLAYAAALAGTIFGITIDYFIAYFLGKEVVYKHLSSFHIRRESIELFDAWFKRNGPFAVFVARLLPVVRGLISLPAGFAEMSLKKFYFYSILGAMIWNAALMAFGYYALSTSNAQSLLVAVATLAIVLYLVYDLFSKKIKRGV